MNTSGLVQSEWSPKGFTLTLQETRSISGFTYFARDPKYSWFHEHSQKNEFIAYIYV